jgi:hypothetical protein
LSNRLEQDLNSDLGFKVGGLGLELVFFSFESVGTFRRGDFSCLLLIRKEFLFFIFFYRIAHKMDDFSRRDRCGFRICFLVRFFLLTVALPSFFPSTPILLPPPSPDSNISRISLQKQSFGSVLIVRGSCNILFFCFGLKESSFTSFVLL